MFALPRPDFRTSDASEVSPCFLNVLCDCFSVFLVVLLDPARGLACLQLLRGALRQPAGKRENHFIEDVLLQFISEPVRLLWFVGV